MPRKKSSGKKTGKKTGPRKKSGSFSSNLIFFSSLVCLALFLGWLARAYLPQAAVKPVPAKPLTGPRKPAPADSAAGLARRGQELLLKTRSELFSNRSILKAPPVFSDCSVDEHYLNCLEIALASDQDAIVADLFLRDYWQQRGAKTESSKNGRGSVLIAMDGSSRMAEIILSSPPPTPQKPVNKPPRAQKAQVAIVMDDLGEDYDAAMAIAQIPGPIAMAIMPFRAKSAETLALALRYGKPALLHMPMEPLGYTGKDPGPDALLLSMSGAQVKETLDKALDAMPGVIGVNNHMGSAFTARADLMTPLLSELKSRGLFFLDSRTTNQSVGMTLAQQMGVRTCARKIFLDNLEEPQAIEQKLLELCRTAHEQGFAIGIGHPYPETIRALQEKLDELGEKNCELAPVSELCP